MRHAATLLVLLALGLALAACPGASSVAPTLDDVLGRVDVPKILECAAKSGAERARCLGAEAASVALDLAVDKAAALIDDAKGIANRDASAGDVTDADRQAMAAELAKALDEVAIEASKAGAP